MSFQINGTVDGEENSDSGESFGSSPKSKKTKVAPTDKDFFASISENEDEIVKKGQQYQSINQSIIYFRIISLHIIARSQLAN